MERGHRRIYPNLFTVLVGRPGLGKGDAIVPATRIIRDAGTANMLSDRMTIEFVLEKLSKGFPHHVKSTAGIKFGMDSSSFISSEELSVFITASTATLPILADLWDGRDGEYSYGTRTKGDYKISSPCLSLLGGSTQKWLIASIPNNAIGGGFTRRVNFVFGKDRLQDIPWPIVVNGKIDSDKLVNDIRHMSTLSGPLKFEPLARTIFDIHYKDSVASDFDDEATASYKTSKWVHAIKIAISLSLSRDDSMTITAADMTKAVEATNLVGDTIPQVFRAIGESDMAVAADNVLQFLEKKGYASFSETLRANWRHVSKDDLEKIFQTFLQAGLIRERTRGKTIMYEAVVQTQTKGTTP
jgi:hypothetical protein